MKVHEMRVLLETMPQDAIVVVDGYEGGVAEVTEVKMVKLTLDVNTEWWYGNHEIDSEGVTSAVHIT